MPERGLTQDMHNRAVLLQLGDILCTPGVVDSNKLRSDITRSLIADAIKRLHPGSVKHVFRSRNNSIQRSGEQCSNDT
jgi:hypothetical protein